MEVRVLVLIATVTLTAIGGGGLLARRVTLNVTTSMPRGLYWLRPAAHVERGSVVAFACPPSISSLVAAREYLPPNFQLLKRVVAIAGDSVCLDGDRYLVAGQLLSLIATHDQAGRPLHAYRFCGAVSAGTVFVAAEGVSSLDSRYFGPVPIADLTTVAPLWTFSSP